MKAQTYSQLWKQMEEAADKNLPKTAAETAAAIYDKALHEHNAPQMISAWMYRSYYQGEITPDSVYSDIDDMERWLAQEQDTVCRSLLSSLLAEIYNGYCSMHSYEMHGRTELAGETVPDDIREWTRDMFDRRVDTLLLQSVSARGVLLTASASDYKPLAKLQKDGAYYHHSLLQILADRAMSVYGKMDDDGTVPVRQRVADIYRNIIDTYTAQGDMPEAVILSTTDYLRWHHDNLSAAGRQADMEALDVLIDTYRSYSACVEAYVLKAEWLDSERRYNEAIDVCNDGLVAYKDNARVAALRNIREQILKQEVRGNVEGLVYPGRAAKLRINYRNVSSVTMQLISTTLKKVPDREPGKSLRYGTVVSEETYMLQPANEAMRYATNDTTVMIDIPGKTGVYMVGLVCRGRDGEKSDYMYLPVTRLKVTSLSLNDGRTEMRTVDAESGHPVEGAVLTFRDNNDNIVAHLISGSDGKVVLSELEQHWGISYDVAKDDDTALADQSLYAYGRIRDSEEKEQEVLTLLTDRSIYRPGQTVHVKGVAYRQNGDTAATVAGKDYTIRLLDVNGKEVAAQDVRTGDFGSFSLEFVLPTAVLNGNFRICDAQGETMTDIRVEEYKRPSFEITFDPVRQTYRVGDTVHITGCVAAYSGASVQDVPLAFTVATQERWSWWRSRDSKGMAADTVMLDGNGLFDIAVELKTDDDDNSSAEYVVEVRVTDESGETQRATTSISARKEAYMIDCSSLPQYLSKDSSMDFTIRTCNNSGNEVEAELNYRLYRLQDYNTRTGAELVEEGTLHGNEAHDFGIWKHLPSAAYRIEFAVCGEETLDVCERSEASTSFVLYGKDDKTIGTFMDVFCDAPAGGLEFNAQQPATFRFGTSAKDAYVFMDILSNSQRVDTRVLRLDNAIEDISVGYKPEYGDGVTVLFIFVKGGKVYSSQVRIKKSVPDTNLKFEWQTFRDKMQPGQQEEWRLVIKNPDGTPALAELLAMMYDSSLDAIYSRCQWLGLLIYRNLMSVRTGESSVRRGSMNISTSQRLYNAPSLEFDCLSVPSLVTYRYKRSPRMLSRSSAARNSMAFFESIASPVGLGADYEESLESEADDMYAVQSAMASPVQETGGGNDNADDGSDIDMSALRTDFAETAFFYPTLRTDSTGAVSIAFTVPESLTRWNFAAYGHTKNMNAGMLAAQAVTQKDFMLRPHLPRFVRTGDSVRLTAVVSNLTDKKINGKVDFELFDPMTDKVVQRQSSTFSADANGNVPVGFDIEVTEKYNVLGVRMVASGAGFSDGEQHLLPVLTNKQYITETVAMSIRGNQTRTFALDSIFNHHNPSATQRKLTVEFTGNPAWYAVQALTAISEPQHDDAIDWASAFYANTLASHIAASQPRIKQVFDVWKQQGASKETFISQLEKSQELKEILLSETPWVMEAADESKQRRRLALLFDVNLMADRISTDLTKLQSLQGSDGGWSWFSGMPSGFYTTTYITGLLIRLNMLIDGMDSDGSTQADSNRQAVDTMVDKAFGYLHSEMEKHYNDIHRWYDIMSDYKLSYMDMQYLYLIAIGNRDVPTRYRTVYEYFFDKVRDNLGSKDVIEKAQSAVILHRAGSDKAARQFESSLKEYMVDEDEMGAHFAFLDVPYTWSMMPIPQHVAAMEALREFDGNDNLIEEMKIWLLKQKQSRSWNSSICTVDAVYALLCNGSSLLDSQGDVRLTLAGEAIETTDAGSGEHDVTGLNYVKRTYGEESKVTDARSITVEKRDDGIAWGAVYAQYLSPMSDVEQQGAEMNIERKLFVERLSADGKKTLEQVDSNTELHVGNVVVSRLTLSLDRAVDFVQLKDRPASCFEPGAQMSGYRWNNGIGYYMEVEDASVNFFFDSLGKGMHVFEVRYTISHAGTCQLGVTTVQSAYAPEFASHTSGISVTVKP